MADTGKNAITTHSGDGSTTSFTVGFSYLVSSHISITVGGSPETGWSISDDGLSVEFDAAPASGTDNIVLTRVTPHASLYVTFSDGAPVTAANLSNAFLQAIYYAEEVEDKT